MKKNVTEKISAKNELYVTMWRDTCQPTETKKFTWAVHGWIPFLACVLNCILLFLRSIFKKKIGSSNSTQNSVLLTLISRKQRNIEKSAVFAIYMCDVMRSSDERWRFISSITSHQNTDQKKKRNSVKEWQENVKVP